MIALANDRIALTLEPDFGARVTSLTDLASGRQWLVPGDCVAGVTYLAEQARGWDECFPTVGLCDHPAWDGPMRDHGEIWGRPWSVTYGEDACTATYGDPRFEFARSLQVSGASIMADYRVTNRGATALPYLWSQHALLATTPADRIELNGLTRLQTAGQPVDWPHHGTRDLSAIGTLADKFALKLYGEAGTAASAEIAGPDGGIRFDWAGRDLPGFGLWLDYGGWPPGNPVHQVALEPTTGGADDLCQAQAIGHGRSLAPGATHRWSVRISLTPQHPRAH